MRCRKAERWLLRSVDGRLEDARARALEAHLAACPSCSRAAAEYREMLGLLRSPAAEEPLPRFWERLRPALKEEQKALPLLLWERWCLRAVPAFLVMAAVIGAGLLVLAPPATAPLTRTELLLTDQNPVAEAGSLFDQARGESRHMELLFAAVDERASQRRFP